MTATIVLLVLTVLPLWLAALGFARLRSAYDRVHCVSFAAVASGAPLLALAFVADGASDRAFKVLLLVGLSVLSGAGLAHAIGRAIAFRDVGEPP